MTLLDLRGRMRQGIFELKLPFFRNVPCPRCGTRLTYRRQLRRRRFECGECWLGYSVQDGKIVQGWN